jgi:DNA modification methylase
MVGYLARNAVAIGDVRELAGRLEPGSVQTIVTSPPYFGLRSYLDAEHEDKARELGGEKTPAEYVANLVAVFAALRNALKDDGTIWLNLGDSYAGQPGGPQGKTGDRAGRTFTGERDGGRRAAGYPQKCLLGIPWRVAFALINDGWILRSDCIWAKPNPMPESVADRPTQSHEYLFLLSKSPRYFYDADAIREPLARSWDATTNGGSMATMRHHDAHIGGTNRHTRAYPEPNPAGANKRSVWAVPSAPFPDAHYATFPPALIRPCVLAGTSEAGECSRCGKAWVRVVERGGRVALR